jgi:hypothetical protein
MRENRSPDATSASRTSGSIQGYGSHTAAVVPAPRAHRGWRRLPVLAAPLVLAAGLLATNVAPAAAASSLNLITTGSSNTTVGYRIYANLNLMNGGVTPTGLATFRLYGPTDPSCTWPIFTSTVAVNGTSINSSAFVTSPCSSASADVIVGKARNILRVTAHAPAGEILSASVTLSGYYPNGTITFHLTGPESTYCSGTPLFSSTVAVNGTGTYASAGFAPSTSGTYSWRATYTGDADNQGSSITPCFGGTNSTNFTS